MLFSSLKDIADRAYAWAIFYNISVLSLNLLQLSGLNMNTI